MLSFRHSDLYSDMLDLRLKLMSGTRLGQSGKIKCKAENVGIPAGNTVPTDNRVLEPLLPHRRYRAEPQESVE